MIYFPEYGLFGCRINPLRCLLGVHARVAIHPPLIPHPGREIEAGTGRSEVDGRGSALLSRPRTSSEIHAAGEREIGIFKGLFDPTWSFLAQRKPTNP